MGPLSSEERAAPGPKRSVLSLRDLCDETVMAIPNSDPAPPAPSPDLAKRKALDDLFSATYEELRRLASSVRRHDAGVTLNPTALVNEAWIKLSRTPGVAETSPLHFPECKGGPPVAGHQAPSVLLLTSAAYIRFLNKNRV